jgi:glucose/mannose-6-phosphate isomerase
MAMILDDIDAIREVDRSDALSFMERTPKRLVPPADADSTCKVEFERPLNVVFGGVGGSGIVGDIIIDYARDTIDVPVSVCRTLSLPRFVGKQTLFVAISYSGETRETLDLLQQAKARDAKIVTITSGGNLLSQSNSERFPYLKVLGGLLPRVALPELLGAAAFVMGAAGLIENTSKLLSESAGFLEAQIGNIAPSVGSQENPAKQMAQALLNRLPLLIGGEENASVLRRFKNELNENSKMPALCFTLPEGYHDDVEGLRTLHELTAVQPVVLLGREESEGQLRTRARLQRLLGEIGFPPALQFEGMGQDKLSRLLTAITFGDYVSVYLAVLRGKDPSELTLIPKFREAMRGA